MFFTIHCIIYGLYKLSHQMKHNMDLVWFSLMEEKPQCIVVTFYYTSLFREIIEIMFYA